MPNFIFHELVLEGLTASKPLPCNTQRRWKYILQIRHFIFKTPLLMLHTFVTWSLSAGSLNPALLGPTTAWMYITWSYKSWPDTHQQIFVDSAGAGCTCTMHVRWFSALKKKSFYKFHVKSIQKKSEMKIPKLLILIFAVCWTKQVWKRIPL